MLGLGLIAAQANAQHFCDAESRTNNSVANNPIAAENLAQLEAFTQAWVEQNPGWERKESVDYVVPVVVHIMHDYSSSSNIPKANVLDAIRILNRDFNVQNSDTSIIDPVFKPYIGGMNIEFKLATIDPNGNCTDGITRTYTELTNSAGENVKQLISWNTEKYYNIWVVRNIASGAGGYAYVPGTAPSPSQEGVVCRSSQFGSLSPSGGGNLSIRTLTHETGHWLNLRHTWGPTNTPGVSSNCPTNVDDNVKDTPFCEGVVGQGCNTNANSCNQIDDPWGIDQKDNVQNYLDYSSCERMFTLGQAARMDAAINSFIGSRKLLWQETNLEATGTKVGFEMGPCPPNVDFLVGKEVVCAGNPTSLTDFSWNGDVDTWSWSVSGSGVNLSSSSDSNITATFTQPGVYDVTLTVTNAGGTVSRTKERAVTVVSDTPQILKWGNYTFEGSANLPTNFSSSSTDTINWEVTDRSGMWSAQSIYLDNFHKKKGQVTNLVLPTVNVQGTSQPELVFDLAFAKRVSSADDQLTVYVSSNCGNTWIPRLTLDANDLNSLPGGEVRAFDEFFPIYKDLWKEHSVSLNSYRNATNVTIRFEFISSGVGNNVLIDNINLRDGALSSETIDLTDLTLMPNPASDNAKLSFSLKETSPVQIRLINTLGQVVETIQPGSLSQGSYEFIFETARFENGLYLIQVETAAGLIERRLVIAH